MFVYINEAHADDEWPVGNYLNHLPSVDQPTTTASRRDVVGQHLIPFLRQAAPALLPPDTETTGTSKATTTSKGIYQSKERSKTNEAGPSVHWLLDPPEFHVFEDVYAPWPIRFYIIAEGRLQFIANPKNAQFSLKELDTKLHQILGKLAPSS